MNAAETANKTSRLGEFILARLLPATKNPPSIKDVADSLKPYFANRLGLNDGRWIELIRCTFDELEQQQLVSKRRLTDSGREHTLRFLGNPRVVAKLNWVQVRNRFLTAMAIGVRPSDAEEWRQIGEGDRLRATMIAKAHNLSIPGIPTLAKALDTLAWSVISEKRQIEGLRERKFTRDNVLRAAYPECKDGDPGEMLPAIAAGATSVAVEEIRTALICQWLTAGELSTTRAGRFSLDEFAQTIRKLATTTTDGRFGENKVFIASIWDQFQRSPAGAGMSRSAFDEHLVEANRTGLLALSRADLIGAMDPETVRQSEVKLEQGAFHLVRTDR